MIETQCVPATMNMLPAAFNIRSRLFSVVYKALHNLIPTCFSHSSFTEQVLFFKPPRLQQCHPSSPFPSKVTPNNSWLRHHCSQEAHHVTLYPGHLLFDFSAIPKSQH